MTINIIPTVKLAFGQTTAVKVPAKKEQDKEKSTTKPQNPDLSFLDKKDDRVLNRRYMVKNYIAEAKRHRERHGTLTKEEDLELGKKISEGKKARELLTSLQVLEKLSGKRTQIDKDSQILLDQYKEAIKLEKFLKKILPKKADIILKMAAENATQAKIKEKMLGKTTPSIVVTKMNEEDEELVEKIKEEIYEKAKSPPKNRDLCKYIINTFILDLKQAEQIKNKVNKAAVAKKNGKMPPLSELIRKAGIGENAKKELITGHIMFPVWIAHNHKKPLGLAETLGHSNEWIIDAADKFDSEKGNSFITFAREHVKGKVKRAIDNTYTTIRRPRYVNDDIATLSRAKRNLPPDLDKAEEQEYIEETTGLTPERQNELKQIQRDLTPKSLSEPKKRGEDEEIVEFVENNKSMSGYTVVENTIDSKKLSQLLIKAGLTKAELEILKAKYLNNDEIPTTIEVAKEKNISRERARELENNALNLLREKFTLAEQQEQMPDKVAYIRSTINKVLDEEEKQIVEKKFSLNNPYGWQRITGRKSKKYEQALAKLAEKGIDENDIKMSGNLNRIKKLRKALNP